MRRVRLAKAMFLANMQLAEDEAEKKRQEEEQAAIEQREKIKLEEAEAAKQAKLEKKQAKNPTIGEGGIDTASRHVVGQVGKFVEFDEPSASNGKHTT